MGNIEAVADSVFLTIRSYIAERLRAAEVVQRAIVREALAALPPPADSLEAACRRIMSSLPPAKDGRDGKDGAGVDMVALLAHVDASVKHAVEALPKARDGKDGRDVDPVDLADAVASFVASMPRPADGKSPTREELWPMVAEAVARAAETIPPAAPGKDGRDGKDADPAQLLAAVAAEVERQVRAIPPAPAGKDADATAIAAQVLDMVIKTLPTPRDGADGKSVTVEELKPLFEGEIGRWELDFERRAADQLQRAVDRLPKPKDGTPGADDFDLTLSEDGRTFSVTMRAAGKTLGTKTMKLPIVLDAGPWSVGAYEKGDGVTFGGSFWIAQRDTEAKPGESPDWRLAVRRGRGE